MARAPVAIWLEYQTEVYEAFEASESGVQLPEGVLLLVVLVLVLLLVLLLVLVLLLLLLLVMLLLLLLVLVLLLLGFKRF